MRKRVSSISDSHGNRSITKVLTGNYTAAYAAKLARVEVIAAYPITPQTTIVEKLSEFCTSGELKATFINVESEFSALSGLMSMRISGSGSDASPAVARQTPVGVAIPGAVMVSSRMPVATS